MNIDINHGLYDCRKASVPFTLALEAFNELAAEESDKFSVDEIQQYYETLEMPKSFKKVLDDPLFGEKKTLFRRTSGNARVTIFDGGHEIVHTPALNWLANQKKGQSAVWNIKEVKEVKASKTDSKVSH
ncbi:MAG: hypothetical protein MK132_11070 [Lentisphaerales bacterium]|nr:hypothetical protein [Lentisphaerales bacterium]